jgi:hypothetical protein
LLILSSACWNLLLIPSARFFNFIVLLSPKHCLLSFYNFHIFTEIIILFIYQCLYFFIILSKFFLSSLSIFRTVVLKCWSYKSTICASSGTILKVYFIHLHGPFFSPFLYTLEFFL